MPHSRADGGKALALPAMHSQYVWHAPKNINYCKSRYYVRKIY